MATIDALVSSLIDLDEERTLELTREILAEGTTTPLSIISACQQAMRMVGERYERKDYFLSALIMSGEIFKEIVELVQPLQGLEPPREVLGTIVLGTVAGDIHDIGKDIFGTALRSYGFRVVDLGVDVPKDVFLEEVLRSRPDVVCLSGLIAAAFQSMRATAELIRSHEAELGYRPFIAIGGGTIDSRVAAYVEADSWSTDAMEGVHICLRFVGKEMA